MAKRAVKRGITVLDPMFALPEGTDEFVYDDRELNPDEGLDAENDGDEGDYSGKPPTPDIIGVLEQTLRRSPEGAVVVDVVLDVSAIRATSKFEVKVTKVE